MRRSWLALALAVPLLAGTACESTFDEAARTDKENRGKLGAEPQALDVAQRNAFIATKVEAVIQDENGTAVVVGVTNRDTQRGVVWAPVSIEMLDAAGKVIGTNTGGDTDPSLNRLPSVAPGASGFYVNDQLVPDGKVESVRVKLGGTIQPFPKGLPVLKVEDFELDTSDPFGIAFTGTVRNASKVEQPAVVVQALARKGGKVVAAGTALVSDLKPGASEVFSGYWIGNPRQAKLSVIAPPTSAADAPGSAATAAEGGTSTGATSQTP